MRWSQGSPARGSLDLRTGTSERPRVRCEVGMPLSGQRNIGHNRWHPDIPPLIEIEPGGEVILESPGYDDYQLRDDDSTADVVAMDLTRVHPLAGPVCGAGSRARRPAGWWTSWSCHP